MEETGSKFTDYLCLVLPNKPNHDGYIRIITGSRKDGSRRLIMSHRKSWERVNGPVPEGFEIHHKCRNRGCSRLEHLELIGISEHKALTNRERAGTGYYKKKRARNRKGLFLPSANIVLDKSTDL